MGLWYFRDHLPDCGCPIVHCFEVQFEESQEREHRRH